MPEVQSVIFSLGNSTVVDFFEVLDFNLIERREMTPQIFAQRI
jgi:hypothetical protein